MGRVGRPDKLTPERAQKFIEAVRRGNYFYVAAQLAGVNYATVLSWLERGRQETSGKFHEFLLAVQKAEAEAEDEAISQVRAAAAEGRDWRAAMEFLARRYRSRWSPNAEVNLKANVDANVQGSFEVITRLVNDPEVAERVAQAFREAHQN